MQEANTLINELKTKVHQVTCDESNDRAELHHLKSALTQQQHEASVAAENGQKAAVSFEASMQHMEQKLSAAATELLRAQRAERHAMGAVARHQVWLQRPQERLSSTFTHRCENRCSCPCLTFQVCILLGTSDTIDV